MGIARKVMGIFGNLTATINLEVNGNTAEGYEFFGESDGKTSEDHGDSTEGYKIFGNQNEKIPRFTEIA
eukprot:2747938-Amphidinium_carterae.1